MKEIDFSKNVSTLVSEYPEVKDIMYDLGFTDIVKPVAIMTIGKMMTIPKGSKVKDIPMETIIDAFEKNEFKIKNKAVYLEDEKDREEILKSLIQQAHDGVPMEIVQEQFAKHFSMVSSEEIAQAEQALINEGLPTQEIQRLCDVHSGIFHGHIEEPKSDFKDVPGHPINIMYLENDAIQKLIDMIRNEKDGNVIKKELLDLKQLKQHYSKKEELFFPLLEKAGIRGPMTVMWGVDDEIRDEIRLVQAQINDENKAAYTNRLEKVLNRAEEMIFKEEQILMPMAEAHFTEAQWDKIYHDFPEMGYCLITDIPVWQGHEQEKKPVSAVTDETVQMTTGTLNAEQLQLIFNAIPMDVTFIDENDTVKFFTNGKERIFPRPLSALGKQVYDCHGPKAEKVVRKLLEDFKAHKRTSMERWIINDHVMVRVYYVALYDENGNYKGTLETSQNMKPYSSVLQVSTDKDKQ